MRKFMIISALFVVVSIVGCAKEEAGGEKKKQLVIEDYPQLKTSENVCEGGDDEDPQPMLMGGVIDSIGLTPVSGVCVELRTISDVFVDIIGTDNAGHYYFNEVDTGSYKLVFSREGYFSKVAYFDIIGVPEVVNVQLRKLPVTP